MSSELLRSVEQEQLREDLPELRPGDDVRVHFRIIEGDRQRIQVVRGIVMRLKGGRGAKGRFTVRRVASHGIGVERTFPLHSPRIEKIEILRHSHIRRKQLYFLRKRRGKAARLKEKRM